MGLAIRRQSRAARSEALLPEIEPTKIPIAEPSVQRLARSRGLKAGRLAPGRDCVLERAQHQTAGEATPPRPLCGRNEVDPAVTVVIVGADGGDCGLVETREVYPSGGARTLPKYMSEGAVG